MNLPGPTCRGGVAAGTVLWRRGRNSRDASPAGGRPCRRPLRTDRQTARSARRNGGPSSMRPAGSRGPRDGTEAHGEPSTDRAGGRPRRAPSRGGRGRRRDSGAHEHDRCARDAPCDARVGPHGRGDRGQAGQGRAGPARRRRRGEGVRRRERGARATRPAHRRPRAADPASPGPDHGVEGPAREPGRSAVSRWGRSRPHRPRRDRLDRRPHRRRSHRAPRRRGAGEHRRPDGRARPEPAAARDRPRRDDGRACNGRTRSSPRRTNTPRS